MTAKKNEYLKKTYESYEGEGPAPIAFFEPWVKVLEGLVSELRKAKATDDTIEQALVSKFAEHNYKTLNKDLLETFIETEDEDYFWLFKKIFELTELSSNGSELEPYTFDILHKCLFKDKQTPAIAKLLEKEVTPKLEFNGSKISIEDFMSLSQKVAEMNGYLAISLLYNDNVKRFVADGVTNLEEAFSHKLQTYRGTVYSHDNEKVDLKEQKEFCNYCDGKKIENPERMLYFYYQAIRLLVIHSESKIIPDELPMGWNNLFIFKEKQEYTLVGNFNSKFNAIKIGQDRTTKVGVFYKGNFTPLSKTDKVNQAKINCLNMIIKMVYDNQKDGSWLNFEPMTARLKTSIEISESASPEKKSIKPIVEYQVYSPFTEDRLAQMTSQAN